MAIFSRTQIPKYQNPVRITRPYIKPNYLADTINSAIQGYGSIQNTNMQRQLFNAKLKAAADAKAQNELNQVTYRQMLSNMAPTQQLEMFYEGPQMGVVDPNMSSMYSHGFDRKISGEGGWLRNLPPSDPYEVDTSRYYKPIPSSMRPYSEMTTQPGMSQMESIIAAMQSNPGARIQDIMAIAGGINKLQEDPTSGLNPYQMQNQANWQQQFDRNEQRYQARLASDQKAIVAKAGTDAQTIVGKVFGKPLLSDFQHKQGEVFGFDPAAGTESTESFLANATWFGLTGVDAYNAMMKDLEQVATKWLLEGKSPNDVRRDLHGIYRQGTQKHSKGWQPPEIPQLLQAQIEENRTKRDQLPVP